MPKRLPLSVLLPGTGSWSLRLAVVIVCVLFLGLGITHAWAVYAGDRGWMSVVLSVVLIGTSIFLWMLKAWARKVALIILGFIVVLVPLAMASPGFFLDFGRHYEGQFPFWIVVLAAIFVIAAPIFWCMNVLNKYKATFS